MKQKTACGHSNIYNTPTTPRKQISKSLSDEREIRISSTCTEMTKLHTFPYRHDSARKSNLVKANQKKRKINDGDEGNVSTYNHGQNISCN
jgi:hypothetical protein